MRTHQHELVESRMLRWCRVRSSRFANAAQPLNYAMMIGPSAAASRERQRLRLIALLRSPDPGLLGQGMRFAIAGATVTVIYVSVTTLLASVVGLAFQVALALGYLTGMSVHFTLQRLFVWTHHEEFALPIGRQIGRYLLSSACQYGVTAASTAELPSELGLPTEAVYIATMVFVVSVNFFVFRHGIFHSANPQRDAPATP